MVGRSLGCGSPHARLLSPKRSSFCVDLLCVFICGNGHQLSLAPWLALTGLRRTTWFLRKGRSTLESLWGMPRRNASVTFFSDGDGGTPSHFVQAPNTWYDIRDTYIVRFVVVGCRKNLPAVELDRL